MATKLTDFKWTRGDTYPFSITIKTTDGPVDLTGFSNIAICFNTEKKPVDTSKEIFKSTGVVDADPTTGKVTFTFDTEQADNMGTFYYDIQGIDASGHRRTFINGNKAVFEQDINKD